ncbi:unnamed protein product [Peronospora belbahrii]|uniref:Reverse transcriptase RNase H-like domain-containing protein n=1 Tax=Peronospora belbahrii TaxID=622444 RepID=A0AAU9L323_9STRA|nr:unnamed protein product [Peronospora belbahrii]CAH0520510.1 unnamed protein product [Peronospora belbahrii]
MILNWCDGQSPSGSISGSARSWALVCALPQADADRHERVIAFVSRQLKNAEKNYPVHDKELLSMKYAIVKSEFICLDHSVCDLYRPRIITYCNTVAMPLAEDNPLAFIQR